jgi:hypothetical protein
MVKMTEIYTENNMVTNKCIPLSATTVGRYIENIPEDVKKKVLE